MERRDVIKFAGIAMGGTALAASVKTSALGEAAKGAAGSKTAGANAAYLKISQATSECLNACEISIAHSQTLLAKGDTMLADCLKRSIELLPICNATKTLANYGSDITPKLAKVCLEACQACADSCKPHIGHHAQCKGCYDACLKCIEACKAV